MKTVASFLVYAALSASAVAGDFASSSAAARAAIESAPSEQNGAIVRNDIDAKRGDRWLIRSEVFVALQGSGVGLQMTVVP